MRKKLKKKRPKISKREREWRSNTNWLYERLEFLEDLVKQKEAQISYFMKYFDNRIELVLSDKPYDPDKPRGIDASLIR